MSVKAFAAKLFAKRIQAKTQKWANYPVETQQKVFQELINEAAQTQFGKDHDFSTIKTDFCYINENRFLMSRLCSA